LVFWLISDSFSRSHGWSASTSGRLRCLPHGAALVGGAAANVVLDPVQGGDARQRLAGDRRHAALCQLVERSTDMTPAEREPHLAPLGQRLIAGVAVDLQDAAEAGEMRDRAHRLAVWRIDVGDDRRVGAAPRSVVARIGE